MQHQRRDANPRGLGRQRTHNHRLIDKSTQSNTYRAQDRL
jgi:hypothetical protein